MASTAGEVVPTARRAYLEFLALVGLGLALMYVPVILGLAQGLWKSDDQGHGPIILALTAWSFYRRKEQLAACFSPRGGRWQAWCLIGFACLIYVVGRSQHVTIFAVGSAMPLLAGLIWLAFGRDGLKLSWFPILFLFFLVPLPGAVVDALTQPMKMGVSWAVEGLLYQLGYPIARIGVMLHIGQYQLLVADACAGLHTLFTVEALGLLYLNLMGYTDRGRNFLMAVLIVPISFFANAVRVIVLVLVTYYFGDEAGQGFVHGFAGMVLFMVALLLTVSVDGILGRTLFKKKAAK